MPKIVRLAFVAGLLMAFRSSAHAFGGGGMGAGGGGGFGLPLWQPAPAPWVQQPQVPVPRADAWGYEPRRIRRAHRNGSGKRVGSRDYRFD